jgi:hypothetical protein
VANLLLANCILWTFFQPRTVLLAVSTNNSKVTIDAFACDKRKQKGRQILAITTL